ETIRSHPTARERWAAALVSEGVLSAEEAEAMLQAVYDRLDAVRGTLGDRKEGSPEPLGSPTSRPTPAVATSVPRERLVECNDALLNWPEGFSPNPRLAKLLGRRRDALGPDGGIDWGHAETLAFASLLSEGVPVRLTGQDVERGTF